jgi:hypothetical protein
MSLLEQVLQEKYGTGFKQRHLREWYISHTVFQQTGEKRNVTPTADNKQGTLLFREIDATSDIFGVV